MKILYHHRTVSKDGMDVHISEMIHAFQELGHEVLVVGPGSHSERDFGSTDHLIPLIRRLLPQFLSDSLEMLYDQIAYRRLLNLGTEFNPDFIYERHNLFLAAGKRFAQKRNIPYLVEVNSPLCEERKMAGQLQLHSLARQIEFQNWCAADLIFPVSGVLAEIIVEAGIERSKVHTLHNGVRLDQFISSDHGQSESLEQSTPKPSLTIGFVGFAREWHRLDKVFHYLSDRDFDRPIRLMIVGDGPAIGDLRTLANSLNIEELVEFAGLVSREKIPSFLSSFDVAILPSIKRYASPLKIFEYMAMGIPILAPNQPNICEILTHGESALLFGGTGPSFENCLDEILSNEACRKRLGSAAKQRILSDNRTWLNNAAAVTDEARRIIELSRGTQ